MRILPAIIGLLLALAGPQLLAVFGERVFRSSSYLKTCLIGQCVLIGLWLAVLFLVLFGEGLPLSAIGFRRCSWQDVLSGVVLACFFIFLFAPAAVHILARFKLGSFDTGLAKVTALPLWYRILAVAAGAIVEETFYRGYAVERLSELAGSYWAGGTAAVIFFGLAHVPGLGWGPAATTLVSGGILTAFYLWQQNLTANIIAHLLTDGVSIVLLPWWGGRKQCLRPKDFPRAGGVFFD